MPSKKSGQKRFSAKAGAERMEMASGSEPQEVRHREFSEQPEAQLGPTAPTMPLEEVLETREVAAQAADAPTSAAQTVEDTHECAEESADSPMSAAQTDQDAPKSAKESSSPAEQEATPTDHKEFQNVCDGQDVSDALAMVGGMAPTAVDPIEVVRPEIHKEEAAEETPPADQDEFEDACEGQDHSHSLPLLSPAVQERVDAVTVVPEAELAGSEVEEPAEEGKATEALSVEEHEVASAPAFAEPAGQEEASESAAAEPEGQEGANESAVQVPTLTLAPEDKLITVESDDEATALGSPDVVSPVGSHAGALSDVESTCSACRLSVVCACTKPGEALAVVGAHSALGAWDPQRALVMSTSAEAFPVWTAELPSEASGSEFKLVIVRGDGGATWEPIHSNRSWPAASSPLAQVTYGVTCQ